MILVVTPLKLEHEVLSAALSLPQRRVAYDDREAVVHGDSIVTAVGGHGKVQFALTTSFLAERVAPRLVVCAGACGSLISGLATGDVVVASETLEHDYTLRFVQKPLPAFAGHPAALAHLQGREWPGFAVHFGRVASGDEDVVESTRGEVIRAATGALAVAWEGAGGARAARFHKLPFLEVRGVTDACGAGAATEFAAHLSKAMGHVAQVLSELQI